MSKLIFNLILILIKFKDCFSYIVSEIQLVTLAIFSQTASSTFHKTQNFHFLVVRKDSRIL